MTSEGETVEVDVQANDIGDAGAPRSSVRPAHGTATIGSIIYTPDAGFSGVDEVVYRVCSPNDQTVCDDGTLTARSPATPRRRTASRSGRRFGPGASGYVQLAAMAALFVLASLAAAYVIDRRRSTHARGTEPTRGRTASSARYDRPVTTRLDVRQGDGLASRLHDRGAGDRR